MFIVHTHTYAWHVHSLQWGYRSSFKVMMKVIATFSFLTVIKLFKYMTIDRRFYFIIRVMDMSKGMLAVFLLIFFLFITAFAAMTMFLFGFKSRDFHNIVSAIFTMFQVSLGEPTTVYLRRPQYFSAQDLSVATLVAGLYDFSLDEWMEDDPFFAPAIMILFSFILILTCVNMCPGPPGAVKRP